MTKHRMVQALLFTVMSICVVSCTGNQASITTYAAGSYRLLAQHCYLNPSDNDNFGTLTDYDIPELQTLFAGKMLSTGPWTSNGLVQDDSSKCNQFGSSSNVEVLPSNFVDANAEKSDILWYSGHGDSGYDVLYPYDSSNPCSGANDCFDAQSPGLPFSGNLKWVVNDSSVAVKGPLDPVANSKTEWANTIFNQQGPGLLGFYGFPQEPTVSNDNETQLADNFIRLALGTSTQAPNLSVGSAWGQAALMSGQTNYGEYELLGASNITLTGAYVDPDLRTFSSTNAAVYTDITGSITAAMPEAFVPLTYYRGGTTGYQYSMNTESYPDSMLALRANMLQNGTTITNPSTNEQRFVSPTYTGEHFEGTQGIYAGTNFSQTCMSHTEAEALAFAISWQAQNNPLPSDAVLSDVLVRTRTVLSGATSIPCIVGYVFEWNHEKPLLGGDGIQVGVDDMEMSTAECSTTGSAPFVKCVLPAPPKCVESASGQVAFPNPICPETTIKIVTTYTMVIPHYYRLWRALGAPINNGKMPINTLSATDAYNKMLATAPSGTFISTPLQGVAATYMTTNIYSSSNIANPVYLYALGSPNTTTVYAIADMVTGQYLGLL